MLRLVVLAVFFAAVWAAPATEDLNSADFDIVVVDSIEDYLAKNPTIESVQEMKSEYLEDRYQLRHFFGSRVAGDYQVASNSYSQAYSNQQDIRVKLNYPNQGVGSIISFVRIDVDQSSKEGRAYIISGGINQRYVSIVIEAVRATYLSYNAQIFGYN